MLVQGVRAQLRRRLLLSYRLDPEVARGLLPSGFRPQLVDGSAVAGVCVLGLERIRPRWAPDQWGLRSENAAHRMAVEWDGDGRTEQGVFIFERHSSAWYPVVLGGRVFPGVHKAARFTIDESGDRYAVTMEAPDETLSAEVEVGGPWVSGLFGSLEEASDFYRAGRIGWSLRQDAATAEPVALSAEGWRVEAGQLRQMRSSFFDALPAGAAEFDSAVVMRGLPIKMSVPSEPLRSAVRS